LSLLLAHSYACVKSLRINIVEDSFHFDGR
jgi:hypothetical protein